MSNYVERSSCSCDTPTGSESRRCAYCLSSEPYQETFPKRKKRKIVAKRKKVVTKKSKKSFPHKVELRSVAPKGKVSTGMNTNLYLDGVKVRGVTSAEISVVANGMARVTVTLIARL